MRKRIWRISEDKFDDIRPELEFFEEKIEGVGYEKEPFEGSFSFESTNNVNVRGMVYSSNPYVSVQKPQFDGIKIRIHYSVIHNEFLAGDELTGEFCILANQTERFLPFSISFKKRPIIAYEREIESLDDFADLAREHFSEALRLFSSDRFSSLVEKEPLDIRLLYRGFRFAPVNPINLDEFLVSMGYKERSTFVVQETSLHFYNVEENLKEVLHITKNTWGYIDISISCDGDFLTVEKESVDSEFFMGNALELNFYIHKNRLHGGKNSCTIRLESAFASAEIPVVASLYDPDVYRHRDMIEEKRKRAELSRLYVDYRLKKMTTGSWAGESIRILDELIALHPEDQMYLLQKAQALVVNKQRQDALWLVSELKRDIIDKKSVEWAYLLYLCTLLEQETGYVNKLTEEIEGIFLLHPEDVRIFWFLLFLREEYVGDLKRKLAAIRQWVMAGYDSPYLYIEAYQLYLQDPLLLTELSDFALRILNWAAKHGQVSVNLAMQFMDLLSDEKEYKEFVFLLATRIYARYPEKDLLFSVVSYLLKNHRWGERYFPWYERSVEKELRLTGLFEAYIMSLPDSYSKQLPQMVAMFFRYENHLPADKKAFIFANVITYKQNDIHLYEQYIPQMQRFSIEQMHLQRMDENLAICYQDMLDAGMVDEDIAKDASGVVFSKKIVCFRSDIRRVLVFHEMLAMPQIANVVNHVAFFNAFNDSLCIFLETADGYFITDDRAYYIEDLLKTDRYYGRLKLLSGYAPNYFLYEFDKKLSPEDFLPEEQKHIKEFLYDERIDLKYKRKKLPLLSTFLSEHGKEDLLVKYLVDFKEYKALDEATAAHIMDLLIISEDYATSYEMMMMYNGLLVPSKSLLRLFHANVLEIGDQADDFVISMLAYLLRQNLFTEDTIAYMTNFFVGPIGDMMALWKVAEARNLSSTGLEERILTQMLYADVMDASSGEIFDAYLKKRVSPMIVEAYLTYWSRKYLQGEPDVPENVFSHTFLMYRKDSKLNESIKLGLTKYLCKKSPLDDNEYQILDMLLQEHTRKNIYFAFYRKMDERLLVKYHLYDKQFVEYRGDAARNLTISYSFNGGLEESERMVEMYDGIYVKQFLMFFGDAVSFQIYPSDKKEEPILSDVMTYQEVVEEKSQSRFGIINRMKSDLTFKNEKELLTNMKRYMGLDFTVKHLFDLQ